MTKPIRERPLQELEVKIAPLFSLSPEIISDIKNIVINQKPSKARKMAGDILVKQGFSFSRTEDLVDLVKVLAVIKDVYGQEEFSRIISKLPKE